MNYRVCSYSVVRQGCPFSAEQGCDGYHTGRGEVRLPADLLRPYDADQMTSWKVNASMGNVHNNEPDLLSLL
jgi:hypothetical protein